MSVGAVDLEPAEVQEPEEPPVAAPPTPAPPAVPAGLPPDPGAAATGAQPAPLGSQADIAPGMEPLPEVPPQPELSADPAENIRRLTEYGRALGAHSELLEKRRGELGQRAADVNSQAAEKDATRAAEALKRRQEENARFDKEREERHLAVQSAIGERAAAAKDIEGAKFGDHRTGAQIAGLILSSIGRAFQAAGGNTGAENEAQKRIDVMMERDRRARLQRLQTADKSLLEARYGFKDAVDNHHAALNDLDADEAAKRTLIANDAAAQIKRLGGSQAAIDSSLLVTQNRAKAAAAEQAIHDREEQRTNSQANASAMQSIARASLGERHEEGVSNRQLRRDLADEKSADKSAKQKAADDEEVARDEKGVPYARVQKGRGGVLGFTDQDKRYGRAISQLQAILDENDHLPAGSRWHNAVLSVASTTNANPSDATTKHEEGTLLGPGGFYISHDAVRAKIEELKTAQETFRHEALRPLAPGEQKRLGVSPAGPPAAATPAAKPSDKEVEAAFVTYDSKKATPAQKAKARDILHAAGRL